MVTVLRYAAFTSDPAGGNPAGVVLDSSDLDDAAMQAIAAEVGYSETAFTNGPDASGVRPVRYFSPKAEVPFCGHATVATAVALAERNGPGEIVFGTQAGLVPVIGRRHPARDPHQRRAVRRRRRRPERRTRHPRLVT